MGHLNHEALTVFERLGDAGLRTAGTPFLIYRGRTRHEVGLEGLLKAFATAAKFHHAVWGPDELFYGELYSSRRVDCPPTLARPATRDAYSACVSRDLVEHDLYDFLLFSLPDNDYYSHRDGPDEQPFSIALADDAMKELVDAHGGIDPFLEQNGVIVVADHAQSHVTEPFDLSAALADRWDVLQPNDEVGPDTELAVGPSGRAAAVWVLEDEGRKRDKRAARVRNQIGTKLAEEVELIAWLADDGRKPAFGGGRASSAQGGRRRSRPRGETGRSRATRGAARHGHDERFVSPPTPTPSPASGPRCATPTPATSWSASRPMECVDGRRHPHPRRQPRLAARRRFARHPAHGRSRWGASRARAMDDQRRRRPDRRALRDRGRRHGCRSDRRRRNRLKPDRHGGR